MEGSETGMALLNGRISSNNRTSSVQGTNTANGTKAIQGSMGKGSAGMDLRNMSKGQTFEGTVIAVKGKSVTIESDGHYLNARMEDSVSISIGEKISFVIRANNDNRIEIAPLRMGNIPMEELVVYKALELAGLKATEKNIEIVKGLMGYQMAVTRDSIFHILGFLIKYPELLVRDVLLMKKIAKSVKAITFYQCKTDDSEQKTAFDAGSKEQIANQFIFVLKTKHLGMITIQVQWEQKGQKLKQDKLHLFIQTEKENIKVFLQKQENQWKDRLREKNMICETEYMSLENEQENSKKIEQIAEEFFQKIAVNGELHIQKIDLEEFMEG